MDYEIVTLKEKYIVGLSTRTNNSAPDMAEKIGALWQRFYESGAFANLCDRVNENTYGVYTHYENGVQGDYDVVVGGETAPSVSLPPSFTGVQVPGGQYAKFSLIADMAGSGVGAAWQEIWALDLPRSYTADFEEYLPGENIKKATVNIYISLSK